MIVPFGISMLISLSFLSPFHRSLKLDPQQYTTQDGEKQDVGVGS